MTRFIKTLAAAATAITLFASAGFAQAPEGVVEEPSAAELDYSKVTIGEVVEDTISDIETSLTSIDQSHRLYDVCLTEAVRQGGEGENSQKDGCEIDASVRLIEHFKVTKTIIVDGSASFRSKASATAQEVSLLDDQLVKLNKEQADLEQALQASLADYQKKFATLDPDNMTGPEQVELHDALTEAKLADLQILSLQNDVYSTKRTIQLKTAYVGELNAWADEMHMASNDLDVAVAHEKLIIQRIRNGAAVDNLTSTTDGVPSALNRLGTVFDQLRNYEPREVVVETPPLSETQITPKVTGRNGDYEAMQELINRFSTNAAQVSQ